MVTPSTDYAWRPQYGPQALFVHPDMECVFEVVYGGARGGGKTDATLGEFALHAQRYGPDAKGLLVRRSATALIPTIERAKAIYQDLGAVWQEQKSRFKFPDGAILYFRYLDRDADADLYQGHDYTRVYVEELTQFVSPGPVDKLKATLRSAAGVPCCFRATCNPGGPGHNWVKERYINPGAGKLITEPNGLTQLFIQAKLSDNPILDINDPMYRERLKLSGSAELVRAWLEGDWDIVEGAFFDGWSSSRNVVKPFRVPDLWTKFIAFDWGYAAPFSVGWWAIASDSYDCGNGVRLPRGGLVRYREWYGSSGKPNEGLRLEAEAVASGIEQRTGAETIAYRVADPSIFREDGGPSLGERMARASGKRWRAADNTRIGQLGAFSGWDQVRARIKGTDDGPMLVVFDTCRDFIRTVPVLQHDPNRAEDLDTKAEDHVADETRYACLSRPLIAGHPVKPNNPADLHRWGLPPAPANSWKTA